MQKLSIEEKDQLFSKIEWMSDSDCKRLLKSLFGRLINEEVFYNALRIEMKYLEEEGGI